DNPHLAIGAITIDPQNTQTVYAGTGDLNVPSGLELGDGLYKSTNGGQTWTHIGLAETRVISKIIVHPQNSDILWVSAMGNIFTQDNQRGIYKTIDGGQTWQQVLWVDVNAGVSEMLIHPNQPDILYATSFNRFRNEDFSVVYGDDAHVWRSVDGGETWQILTEGLPQGNFSRMGIAISESNPEVLYVSVADSVVSLSGIYKTTNGGDQWQPVNGDNLLSNFGDPLAGFGWYFGKIYINPANEQVIYLLGVDQYYSLDGGETWNRLTPEWWNYTVHADGHYLDFISDNEFILSTDGGMYRTTNGGLEWQVYGELPITQFYHVTAHPTEAEWVYGGAQDNGTTSGNYLGLNQWSRTYGGDGFKTLIHPETPEILYVSTQYGGFNYSEDGGFSFSGLNMPEETGEYRFGWDAPWLLNPVNPQQLFFGGTHVYRIDDAPFGLPLEISPLLVDSLSNEEHEAKYVHSITSIDVSENDD
ncbi:MAG: WD40/YVTN/BNR-like repeat-containing protein, partial [Flavobacteriales bacterium]